MTTIQIPAPIDYDTRRAELRKQGLSLRAATTQAAAEVRERAEEIANATYRRDGWTWPDPRGRHCRTCGMPLVVRRSDVADGTELAHRMEDMRRPDYTPHTADWA